MGTPITNAQLAALIKEDSILYQVQLHSVQDQAATAPTLSAQIREIITKFADVFEPVSRLPPSRPRDHTIPLLPGAQPFKIRPYRYNLAQKTEIENQIKELLQKGLIQSSTSPFSSPALLVKNKTGD